MPAVVMVDAERVVRWADVHADYTTRTDVATILDALGIPLSALLACR